MSRCCSRRSLSCSARASDAVTASRLRFSSSRFRSSSPARNKQASAQRGASIPGPRAAWLRETGRRALPFLSLSLSLSPLYVRSHDRAAVGRDYALSRDSLSREREREREVARKASLLFGRCGGSLSSAALTSRMPSLHTASDLGRENAGIAHFANHRENPRAPAQCVLERLRERFFSHPQVW